MLLFDQTKALEKALGEEAARVIADAFEKTDAAIRDQQNAVRNALASELATKADVERIEGRIAKLDLMLKLLIGLAVAAIALFSPNLAALIKLAH